MVTKQTAAAKPAPTPAPVVQAAAAAEPAKGKSIIDPKYRDKYKAGPDWLGQLLLDNASTFKEVAEGEGVNKIVRQVPTGVDVEALFKIAGENGLDVGKYREQVNGHGFAGRFRMTVRNMLQSIVKQRHGLWVNGKFVDAPEEFLRAKSAPTNPTHNQKGEKIGKEEAKTAEQPAAANAPQTAAKTGKKR